MTVKANCIKVTTRRHKPINEGSVEVDVWGFSLLENLVGVVDGVEVGAKPKKLEDHKWVLALGISYDFGMYWLNLINVFAFL